MSHRFQEPLPLNQTVTVGLNGKEFTVTRLDKQESQSLHPSESESVVTSMDEEVPPSDWDNFQASLVSWDRVDHRWCLQFKQWKPFKR
ncbi:MAG: uncharacterized protein KVP18_003662 [Porospora cf. gigantea A]|uniref:uncharacterized protein n=1 Tax=Porospora cf. gigantea A TaxID=2853593 RepID=UPI00355A175C|nr:MAG: hypothetical protein KVP18_003662 [Porospora cf. gigantea A]